MKYVVVLSSLSSVMVGCTSADKQEPVEENEQENTNTDTASTETEDTQVDTNDTTQIDETGVADTDSAELEQAEYCEGNNPELANCDPERTYDPWTAHGGEVHYWIRDAKTEVYPFTVIYDPEIWYGYLHLTTGERVRDMYTEDIFHVWYSETPNGPVLDNNPDCEYYSTQADLSFYWKQDNEDPLLEGICFIGAEERVLYLNYETRCIPGYYEGPCDDENKQKSEETYQFDVSRRIKIQ